MLASAWVAPAAAGNTLHVIHERAAPAFERDEALCGSGAGGGFLGYLGSRRVCADAVVDRLHEHPALVGGGIDAVVLLTSRPMEKTIYQVHPARRVFLSLADLTRQPDVPLTVRGQRDGEGGHLVWLKGLPLIDSVCDPERVTDVGACRAGRPWHGEGDFSAPFDGRYEMQSLALIEEARVARAHGHDDESLAGVTRLGPRGACVRMENVQGVSLVDLAFEDCWFSAVQAVNSRAITLSNARIHGSTFGLLAIATSGREADAHTYRVSRTHWLQSPGAYQSKDAPCAEPHRDLSCALDVWDDLPWVIVHHHLWRPLNGALFAATNIAGNVLVDGNLLERAYNGVRIIAERPGTGRNVEIRGNRFRFLRDNAVEPEVQADGWIVKHNSFENVHAWISTSGVRGGSMYLFGNTGWFDSRHLAGQHCDETISWGQSPRFLGLAGDRGRYALVAGADGAQAPKCRDNSRGVILKTGDEPRAGFPYFQWISIFNNGWRTRSPLFASAHAAPLSHFNNAIAFTGCGLDGPPPCRQVPAPLEECQAGNDDTRGRVGLDRFWTVDGGALAADCFSATPGPAQPDARAADTRIVDHVFCRDAVNRAFTGLAYGDGPCRLQVRPNLFAEAEDGEPRPAEVLPLSLIHI